VKPNPDPLRQNLPTKEEKISVGVDEVRVAKVPVAAVHFTPPTIVMAVASELQLVISVT
jgi:hypothetical protein